MIETATVVTALLAVWAIVPAWAAPHYAVGSAGDVLYALGTGTTSSVETRVPIVTSGQYSFDAVTSRDGLVFAVATDAVSNNLHVYRVSGLDTSPTATLINSVPLTGSGALQFTDPGSIALDASGGIYITGGQWVDDQQLPRYTYAYVEPTSGDWTSASVSIGELKESPMVDVAGFGTTGNGAIILHTYIGDGSIYNSSYVTNVHGSSPGTSKFLDDGRDPPLNRGPKGIAVNTEFGSEGYAYVINGLIGTDTRFGTLSVVNPASSMSSPLVTGTIELPYSMVPQSVATWSLVVNGLTKQYLGIVGTVGSLLTQEAWRIELKPDGTPNMQSINRYTLTSSGPVDEHFCAASEDGEMFWITSPTGEKVVVLNSMWQNTGWFSGANLPIRHITSVVVPEPSSLAALLVFAAAGFGLMRRRVK